LRLYKLGYLPIRIKALPEGTFVPIQVPMFTIENTLPEFYWLPGFLEVILSDSIWQPITDATIADHYKRILSDYAAQTGGNLSLVNNQAGDFSMRGMGSPEAAYRCGGGHLLSFNVSSTISVREYLKTYYLADSQVSLYAPSTEHSVMCSYGRDELAAYKQLITKVYPSGNVTIVSDSYDFWGVVDNVLPSIKDLVLARHGKVSIRPDSGDPVKILCGDNDAKGESVRKGLVERLYEIFGGEINTKGYKQLDPHIGAVYGDAITVDRARQICERLKTKGFASTNVVLGIGSYTYQYNTRDTLGFALKCTAEVRNGQFKPIFKDPKTDTGNFKKSHKGLVAVVLEDGEYRCIDELDPQTIQKLADANQLREVYANGEFVNIQTFADIKQRVSLESDRVYGKKGEHYE